MNGSQPIPARLAWRWIQLYTRGLPEDARERRRLELESDIWEHLNDPYEQNAVRALLGRLIRGIPADVRWRYRTLLEQRGVRQRSTEMTTSIGRNWWVILTAVNGAAMVTLGLLGAVMGAGDGGSGAFRAISGVVGIVAGALVLGGLIRRRTSPIDGSRLIFAGSLLTGLSGLELIPLGMILLISGFWTGNLQLTERPDEPALRPVRQQQVDMTAKWYVWVVAAAVLFAIGWIPLIFDGDKDLPTGGYFTWVLSWLGAITTGSIGVILGGLRLVVRHRTRLA